MNSNSKVTRKPEIIAYLLLILTMVIWGGTWPLGKWLVTETIPPMMIAAIRYFLAIICFFTILKFKEGTLNWHFAKENCRILTLMGIVSVTI